MEFLRFAGSIPGSYWGCCAFDVIQCFDKDPDAKASIQVVCGDEGNPLSRSGQEMFFGPTYRDIFINRIRTGTFGLSDMPNHGFLAVLTDYQVRTTNGKKWLELLAEQGFEFIRAIDNSVYTGSGVLSQEGGILKVSSRPNYLFGLFRNIGTGALEDPFDPPQAWKDVSDFTSRDVTNEQLQEKHLEVWQALAKTQFVTREELKEAGAPIILAGRRSENPQEEEWMRIERNGEEDSVDPFSANELEEII